MELSVCRHINARFVFVCLTSLVMASCTTREVGQADRTMQSGDQNWQFWDYTYRLNHIYSAKNQKTSESALKLLEEISDDATGLTAKIATNLAAQSKLDRQVVDLRIKTEETDALHNVIGLTWIELIEKLYADLGYTRSEVNEDDAGSDADAKSSGGKKASPELIQYRKDFKDLEFVAKDSMADASEYTKLLKDVSGPLANRIKERISKVKAVMQVLKALAQAKLKRVELAKKQANALRIAVTPKDKADVDRDEKEAGAIEKVRKELVTLTDYINLLESAVSNSMDKINKQMDIEKDVNQIFLSLLSDINRAKEKDALAASLVPIIGTGLDDDSFKMLDDYLEYLSDELKALSKQKDVFDAKEVKSNIKSGLVENGLATQRQQEMNDGTITGRDNIQDKIDNEMSFLRKVLEDPEKIKTSLEDIDKQLARLEINLGFELADFSKYISNINKLTEPKVRDDKASKALGTANVLVETSADWKLRTSKQILSNLKSFTDGVEMKVDPKDQEYINGVIDEIASDRIAAMTRIQSFMAELRNIEADLHGEGNRHLSTVLGISRAELKRWRLLEKQNDRFVDLNTPVAKEEIVINAKVESTDKNRILPRLFPASGVLPKWEEKVREVFPVKDSDGNEVFIGKDTNGNEVYVVRNQSGNKEITDSDILKKVKEAFEKRKSFYHPRITERDRIGETLRRLALCAKLWQTRPQTRGSYIHVHHSNQRLVQAIELIERYLLMVSINVRYSELNGVRLRKEMSEHRNHLDALAARLYESEMRRRMQDIVAFHSTGIKYEDIQTLISVAQTAYLSVIAGEI